MTPLRAQVVAQDLLGDLLTRTARWPRRLRGTLSAAVERSAIGVVGGLARYRCAAARRRAAVLERVDGRLETLRVLLRVAVDQGILSEGGLRHLTQRTAELGRLLGGLRRSPAATARAKTLSPRG